MGALSGHEGVPEWRQAYDGGGDSGEGDGLKSPNLFFFHIGDCQGTRVAATVILSFHFVRFLRPWQLAASFAGRQREKKDAHGRGKVTGHPIRRDQISRASLRFEHVFQALRADRPHAGGTRRRSGSPPCRVRRVGAAADQKVR